MFAGVGEDTRLWLYAVAHTGHHNQDHTLTIIFFAITKSLIYIRP